MAKYLFAYHGGGMPQTEEETNQVMAAWTAWMGELGSAIVDAGNPVGQAMTVGTLDGAILGGGANPVTGYSVIEAPNMDAAVAYAQTCPVLLGGATVEVCETFDVM
jgi:hypothetical protein